MGGTLDQRRLMELPEPGRVLITGAPPLRYTDLDYVAMSGTSRWEVT